MTEQDREKKIAEIRERHDRRNENGQRFAIFQGYAADDIFFLLQEIERLRQLYEREREITDWVLERVKNLREERNQDRQWIEKASENVTQLQQERDKLIGVLRWYANMKNYEYRTSYLDQDAPIIDDSGQRARNILKEIGVTVE